MVSVPSGVMQNRLLTGVAASGMPCLNENTHMVRSPAWLDRQHLLEPDHILFPVCKSASIKLDFESIINTINIT